jgi:hypothetical protein
MDLLRFAERFPSESQIRRQESQDPCEGPNSSRACAIWSADRQAKFSSPSDSLQNRRSVVKNRARDPCEGPNSSRACAIWSADRQAKFSLPSDSPQNRPLGLVKSLIISHFLVRNSLIKNQVSKTLFC